MDIWERRPPPPRHRRNSPSFSSSLLDAIYRSIDESDGGNLTADPPLKCTLAPAGTQKNGAVSESPVTRLHYTSTSSDSSSHFSSSSSSGADSARNARLKPVRNGPVLTRCDRIQSDSLPPPPPPPNPRKKLRDLMKSTSPSSPGAKLAGFLNSLFTASSHKKSKISVPSPAEDPSPSLCSSASSFSRSCLSKTPSTSGSAGGRRSVRSVRFCPVGVIVGEDCRPCGEKFLFDGEMEAVAAATAAERRKMMVEELLKGFEVEEEEEESGDESEDLFELDNLAGIGGGRFRDELPVYETTDLGMNCAIAKGLVV